VIASAGGGSSVWSFNDLSNMTPSDDYPAGYVGVGWAGNTVVRLERYVGLNMDWFDFFDISERTGVITFESKWLGENCVRANGDGRVACLQDGVVLVNDKVVYSESPFDQMPQLESVTVSVGVPAQAQVVSAFQVLVTSIEDGVSLTVTLPDGTWSTMNIDDGGLDSFTYAGDDYAFLPAIVDRAQRTVRVGIVKGRSGFRLSALAWLPNDDGLLLARTNNGEVYYVLIRPDLSSGGASWRRVGDLDSLVTGEIDSMRFELPWLVGFSVGSAFGVSLVDFG
jgi:hypothetical protein